MVSTVMNEWTMMDDGPIKHVSVCRKFWSQSINICPKFEILCEWVTAVDLKSGGDSRYQNQVKTKQ